MFSYRSPLLWILLGVLAQTGFVALYLGTENTVHFWDYAMYAGMATSWHAIDGFFPKLAAFVESFSQNYNLLFALPSQFSFALFGTSRTAFILTQTATFFLAYQAAVAFVLSRLFNRRFLFCFATTIGLTALIPFVWFPLLEGYPDHAASACLAVALALLIPAKRSLRDNLLAGLALAFAIIFRRHYAYASLAFLTVSACMDLYRSGFRAAINPVVTTGLAALATLLLVEPFYLMEMATTNFQALYQSYNRGAGYFALFTATRIGVGLLLVSIAGLVLAFRNKQTNRSGLILGLGFISLWFIVWSLGPAQAADHYLITVLPLLAYIGIAGLLLNIRKRWLASALVIALLAKSAYALWFAPAMPLPSDKPVFDTVSTARPPWKRTDMNDLLSLARNLTLILQKGDRVAVAGSSFSLNQDLVRALFTDIMKDTHTPEWFVPAPETDGPMQTPIDAVASANVYIVPRTAQYHLDPSGQKVVTAFWSALQKMRDETMLIERMPARLKLMGGVPTEIWRRKAWTPELLVRTIMHVAEQTGYIRPWVATQWGRGVQILMKNETADITTTVYGIDQPASVFFVLPLAGGTYNVQAKVQKSANCSTVAVGLRLNAPDGNQLWDTTLQSAQDEAALSQNLEMQGDKAGYLSIDLWNTENKQCGIKLSNLKVLRIE